MGRGGGNRFRFSTKREMDMETLNVKAEVRDEKQFQGVVGEVVKEYGRRGSWQS
jgi:hypothetical protein